MYVRDKNTSYILYLSCQLSNRIGTLTMCLASDSWWGGPNLSIPSRGLPLDPLFVDGQRSHRNGTVSMCGAPVSL